MCFIFVTWACALYRDVKKNLKWIVNFNVLFFTWNYCKKLDALYFYFNLFILADDTDLLLLWVLQPNIRHQAALAYHVQAAARSLPCRSCLLALVWCGTGGAYRCHACLYSSQLWHEVEAAMLDTWKSPIKSKESCNNVTIKLIPV